LYEHSLITNHPITAFLDSDYTTFHQEIANSYTLPFEATRKNSKALVLTKLPEDSVRGGLLGQASIHALTSNGVETLPVTRGHWVLDELMGTPPPPPPTEVPALVPDTTGAVTPRDQLVKHREDPSCYSCHKLMDPPGLALENFDIIGRYRTAYGRHDFVDPSGEYKGVKFDDVRGLRKALLKDKHIFATHFIEKLAEYAKGRKLNRNDMDIVKALAKQASKDDYRFLGIMRSLLLSDLMLYR